MQEVVIQNSLPFIVSTVYRLSSLDETTNAWNYEITAAKMHLENLGRTLTFGEFHCFSTSAAFHLHSLCSWGIFLCHPQSDTFIGCWPTFRACSLPPVHAHVTYQSTYDEATDLRPTTSDWLGSLGLRRPIICCFMVCVSRVSLPLLVHMFPWIMVNIGEVILLRNYFV